MERHRWLRPFAPWLNRAQLWQLERHAVARGVAVGLFFGLLLPMAQLVFVAVAAIWVRANIPVAVLATFVTNPFTYPPIYYGAFRIGHWLLEGDSGTPALWTVTRNEASLASRLTEWLLAVGPALALGLLVLAVVSALFGYVSVQTGWRLAILLRRRRAG
jgi:uncharacterized protein (DUF2062 family)